jgi:ribosomal protein S18 acetylase RimI-like enzyme
MVVTSLAGCAVVAAAVFGAAFVRARKHVQRRAEPELVIRELRHEECGALEKRFESTTASALRAMLDAVGPDAPSLFIGWKGREPMCVAWVSWAGPLAPVARAAYPHYPEIYSVEVHAGDRSKGMGSQILAHCEGVAIARGFAGIVSAVAVSNHDAYALYLRLGYAEPQRVEVDAMTGTDLAARENRTGHMPMRYLVKSL